MGAFGTSGDSALALQLARLDTLVDWERRDRSAAALQSMRVDVEPARELCRRLGAWPGPAGAARPVVVHVAGSKGKGSVAAWVDASLRAAGWRTARYASPHVERVTERVVLEGREVEPAALAAVLARALDLHDAALVREPHGVLARATWFDLVTAASFALFAEARLDAWVVECGLGGRLDSTNALEGDVAVITSIELEHTAILGETRDLIALEKAGIFEPGAHAVVGLAPPGTAAGRAELAAGEDDPASRAIAAHAARLGVAVTWVPAAARSTFDQRNRALAAAVLDALGARGHRTRGGEPIGRALVERLPAVAGRLPGRWERLVVGGTPVVLDGAHVAASLDALLDQLGASRELSGRPVVVLGMGRDKDADALLKCLVGRSDRVLCSSAGAGPYLAPEVLAKKASALGLVAETVPDPRMAVQRALTAAAGRWVLVTGSLHLVGAVRGSLLGAAQPGFPC